MTKRNNITYSINHSSNRLTVADQIKMSGEDTTTYGQTWDPSVFGPGVPRDAVETVHRNKTFKGFRYR